METGWKTEEEEKLFSLIINPFPCQVFSPSIGRGGGDEHHLRRRHGGHPDRPAAGPGVTSAKTMYREPNFSGSKGTRPSVFPPHEHGDRLPHPARSHDGGHLPLDYPECGPSGCSIAHCDDLSRNRPLVSKKLDAVRDGEKGGVRS